MAKIGDRILGKCSICGGDVTLPGVWHGVNIPTPTCEQCGAVAANERKTIPMVPRKGPSP